MAGKKTLLVDFDFRNPEVGELMQLDISKGVTSAYLQGLSVEQFIQGTFTKNLDILLTGPVPPNPDELIESEQSRLMFENLRKAYDYIILDTPPIGLFGDAFLINKYCDATAYIVRHNFTRKKEFVSGINDAQSNGLKNINLVYNCSKQALKGIDIGMYDEEAPGKFFVKRWFLLVRRHLVNFLRRI